MQKQDSLRRWYVWAGYAGLGLPAMMTASWVVAGASPIFLAVAVVGWSPLLYPALKLRAFARTASSNTQVAVASAVAVGVCALLCLWTLLMTQAAYPEGDGCKRIGSFLWVLSMMLLVGIGMSEILAHKAEQKPAAPPA